MEGSLSSGPGKRHVGAQGSRAEQKERLSRVMVTTEALASPEQLGWPFRAGPTEARGLGLCTLHTSQSLGARCPQGGVIILGRAAFFGQMQFLGRDSAVR